MEEKATACQMLVCYARELKQGFAAFAEDVVKLMVAHLKFYFHDGEFCLYPDLYYHPLNSDSSSGIDFSSHTLLWLLPCRGEFVKY